MNQTIHYIRSRGWMLLLFFFMSMAAAPSLYAQSPPEMMPLNIGDTVPDITFNHMLNYKSSTAKLSDFRGKPVILDFFGTWCGSCIASLPKLDSLQKQFGDSIQILVVGYESESKVAAFLQNNAVGRSVSIPIVTDDSVLSKFFPHRLIPHEVWIDQQGAVIGITQPEYVNNPNITRVLAGKPLILPLKKDILDFDRDKPLLNGGNGGNDDGIIYRSLLTRYLNGVGSMAGISYNYDSSCKRIYYINLPLIALYLAAVRYSLYTNRIILKTRDSLKFIDDNSLPWNEWVKENSYCYELTVPSDADKDKISRIMLQDLDRYFELHGRKEMKIVPCWALIRTGEDDSLLRSNGGRPMMNREKGSPRKVFHNQPLSKLVNALNEQVPGRPLVPIVVDKTKFIGNADLYLKVENIHDISAMREALQPYELDLVPIEEELEMFVLTDNSPYMSPIK